MERLQAVTRRHYGAAIASALALTFVLLLPVSVYACYPANRPGPTSVNQTYLYGEVYNGYNHRGVDFYASRYDAVYPVAAGTVVDRYASLPNGTEQAGLGNYVVIQHGARLWDEPTREWRYVYSIYAHLAYASVPVAIGSGVTTSTRIGQVDDTGRSDGDHLHLQINTHLLANCNLACLDYSTTSRNPELWLKPLSAKGIVTGRYADSSGNPIPNVFIWFSRSDGASAKDDSIFQHTQNYSHASLNRDSFLLETWATTDVKPGTYTLIARDAYGTELTRWTSVGVSAGKTTYVNMESLRYRFLPDVRLDYGSWNSEVIVRNDGPTSARVRVWTLDQDGTAVGEQDHPGLPPKAIWAPSVQGSGSMIVASTQDVSAVTVNHNAPYFETYAYTGIPEWSPSGIGSAPTLYLPSALNNYYGWSTDVFVQNTTADSVTVTARYYDSAGNLRPNSPSVSLAPYDWGYITRDPWLGWGRLETSPQRDIAAVVSHYMSPGNAFMAYSVAERSGPAAYLPSLLKNYYYWTSAYTMANTTTSTSVETIYFRPGGSIAHGLNAYASVDGYLGNVTDPAVLPQPPASYSGAGAIFRTAGGGQIVAAGQHSQVRPTPDGGTQTVTAMGMHGLLTGAASVNVPFFRDNATWTGSLTIQNMGSTTSRVTVRCYNPDGTRNGGDILRDIAANYSVELLSTAHGGPLPQFAGSIEISSSLAPVGATVQQSVNDDNAYGYAVP